MRKKQIGAERVGQKVMRSDSARGAMRSQERPQPERQPAGAAMQMTRTTKSLMKTSDLATRGRLSRSTGL